MSDSNNNFEGVNYKKLGIRVRDARLKMGLTQMELAELADLSCSFIGHIERGEKPTSVETLARLSQVLDKSLDDLIFGRWYRCAKDKCPRHERFMEVLEE